ncbi:MAG TPA: ATP-binding protein [Clostridiales bacterium]|nr:ATP-binding protein [Clostridiales bacterium]
MDQERLILFTGHFGSGKTEIAVNYAIKSAQSGQKTILVDLDIVNPFFRSTEVKDKLEECGIKVISPNFAVTTVDIPSLPAEIYSVFADKSSKVIFDVGGDETGARALGQYFPYFRQEHYRMYYVINIRRPLSSTAEDIISMMQEVEQKSRLKVTHLINNTNLSYETEIHDIIEGQAIIEQVSKSVNIPIEWTAGVSELLDRLPENIGCKLFPIEIYMKPPWQQLPQGKPFRAQN